MMQKVKIPHAFPRLFFAYLKKSKKKKKKFHVSRAKSEILFLVTNNRSICARKCRKRKECAV